SARMLARDVISGLGMLKNFMSIFIFIGSKFGGNELRNKVFMTPTQIYNNIVEYIQASAFCQGFGQCDGPENQFRRDGSKLLVPESWTKFGKAKLGVALNMKNLRDASRETDRGTSHDITDLGAPLNAYMAKLAKELVDAERAVNTALAGVDAAAASGVCSDGNGDL